MLPPAKGHRTSKWLLLFAPSTPGVSSFLLLVQACWPFILTGPMDWNLTPSPHLPGASTPTGGLDCAISIRRSSALMSWTGYDLGFPGSLGLKSAKDHRIYPQFLGEEHMLSWRFSLKSIPYRWNLMNIIFPPRKLAPVMSPGFVESHPVTMPDEPATRIWGSSLGSKFG